MFLLVAMLLFTTYRRGIISIKLSYFAMFFRLHKIPDRKLSSLTLFPVHMAGSRRVCISIDKRPQNCKNIATEFAQNITPTAQLFSSLSLSLRLYSQSDLGRFFQFINPILGQGISPSQRLYLRTEQHKQRINVHRYPCL
jgi:hypothetical protein